MSRALLFLGSCLAVASATDVTPVQKVLGMLEDLQKQVQEEGKQEAIVYDKFACFCKDMTDEKTKAINEGQTNVDSLMAKLEELQTERADLIADIEGLEKDLDGLRKEKDEEHKSYKEQLAVDESTKSDLDAAVSALKRATSVLKSSGDFSSSFIQQKVQKLLAKAMLVASTHNVNYQVSRVQKIAAFLQQGPDSSDADSVMSGHESDYDFHSNDIIKTLEDLTADFKGRFNEHVKEMMQRKHDHNMKIQGLEDNIKATTKAKEQKESEREEKTKNISTNQQDLTEAQAQLKDDQVYLKEVTGQCEEKAKLWDQRTRMRSDELAALSQAIAIIAGTVKEKDELETVGHVSALAITQHVVRAVQGDEAEQLMAEDDAASFVQVASKSMTPRDQLVALLRQKASLLGSRMLSTLAESVSADPLAKVKKLIQELVERLLQEAEDEADHKGWCDTEIGLATQERDLRFGKLQKVNGELINNNARKDKLESQLETLDKELTELRDALVKATEERKEEKENNAQTVKDSEEGLDAIKQALDILTKFYKAAGKGNFIEGKSSLVQEQPEIPDAGIDEEYKGSQGASTGILGMMQVIQSDFERTIKETNKAERESARAFVEYERETKMSIKTKEVAEETKTTELKETNGDISEGKDDMMNQQQMLDASLKELEKLKPACAAPSMSYEERKKRREAEIEALKQALDILASAFEGEAFLQKK